MPEHLPRRLDTVWHSILNRWHQSRSSTRRRRPFWDGLILTAANTTQARSYEREIARRQSLGMVERETRVAVVPDPKGRRIGSGGATIWALDRYADGFEGEEPFENRRILMIHCGGEGRRVPSSASTGKLFSPLPFCVVPGRAATAFDALYAFLCLCGLQMREGLVVVSGDVLAVFEPEALHWNRAGCSGIGIPTPFDVARHHGVYVPDATGRRVGAYLQKPSRGELERAGGLRDAGRCALVDGAGIFRFAPDAAERLRRLAVLLSGGQTGGEPIDLYTDIAWPMVPSIAEADYVDQPGLSAVRRRQRAALWESLSGLPFWLDVMENACFVHLGNLWQMQEAFASDGPEPDGGSGEGAASGGVFGSEPVVASYVECPAEGRDLAPSSSALNSVIRCSRLRLGAQATVSECRLGAESVQVGARSLVRGVETKESLRVPPDVALFCVPLRGARVAWCVHGTRDNPKERLDEGARFLGGALSDWLGARGIREEEVWPDSGGDRSLWTARLHPISSAADGRASALRAALGMCKGGSSGGAVAFDAWRTMPRASFAEVFSQADYVGAFELREQLIRDALLASVRGELQAGRDPRGLLEALGSADDLSSLWRALETWISEEPHPLRRARMEVFRADLLRSPVTDQAVGAAAGDDLPFPRTGRARRRLALECENGALRDDVARAVAYGVRATEPLDLRRVVRDRVVIESPARIDFGGGWTDTPPQCLERGGVILSAAIRLNGARPVRVVGERIAEREIVLESEGVRGRAVLRTAADLGLFQDLSETFALPKAALAAIGLASRKDERPGARPALEEVLGAWGHGLRIRTSSNVPRGSGLGTSSILGAAVVACLRRLFGADLARDAIFRQVLYLEQLLTSGGGWQDQLGCLVPGVKLAAVPAREDFVLSPKVDPLDLDAGVIDSLNRQLVLFYVGKRRVAFNLLREIVIGYLAGRPNTVSALGALHDLAYEQRDSLLAGDLERFGAQMTRIRMLYRLMCPATTSDTIESIFAAAAPHAYGGKCIGAGGGGFLMVLARSAGDAVALRQAMREFSWRGLGEFYDFSVDGEGLCVVEEG